MLIFFHQLWRNVLACYRGKNLVWQAAAVALTYAIVASGFDWWWYEHTRSASLQAAVWPAVIVGGLLPMWLPFIVLAWGAVQKSALVKHAAGALGQAAGLGFLVSTTYKAFTGRVPPDAFRHLASGADVSGQWRFGFLRGGVFWGWPSSHTTVSFAMAWALAALFPERPWVRYACLAYALYVGLGVSTNIHWFSEFAAGAIFGSIIGIAVGKSFYQRFRSAQA